MTEPNNNTPTHYIERVIIEKIGDHGTVERIELTEAGRAALTTTATSLGTGYYISRADREAMAAQVTATQKRR